MMQENFKKIALGGMAVFALVTTAVASPKTGTGVRQVSQKVRFSGTFGASASSSWVKAGDTFEADCLGQLDGNTAVTIRFNNFAAPTGSTSGNYFSMNLVLEVTGAGVVYNGPAEGLNSQVVHLNASDLSGGVAIKLSRKIVALKDVPADVYANIGSVIISRM